MPWSLGCISAMTAGTVVLTLRLIRVSSPRPPAWSLPDLMQGPAADNCLVQAPGPGSLVRAPPAPGHSGSGEGWSRRGMATARHHQLAQADPGQTLTTDIGSLG